MTCGEKRLKDRKSEPALVVAMPPRDFDSSFTVKVCSVGVENKTHKKVVDLLLSYAWQLGLKVKGGLIQICNS